MNQRQDQHKLLIFNAQAHQAILKIVEIFLPLEISARDLDDKMLREILCHAPRSPYRRSRHFPVHAIANRS